MSALPSQDLSVTPAAPTTFADVGGPHAKPSTIKLAIEKESVWLPKRAAGGHGLRADDLLRYACAVDRADNGSGELQWRTKTIDARCGITAKKPKPVTKLLAKYIEKGLLSENAVSYSPGQSHRVRIERTLAEDSIRIPLGVLWEYRWANEAPTGPCYDTDTRYVLVWLAAWLYTAEYVVQGVTYTSVKTYNGLPRPAEWIAEQAGISLATYRRAWDTVRRVCADADWVTWERKLRPDMGHDAYDITIDWAKAPRLKDAPHTETPSTSEEGTPPESGQGVPLQSEQADPREVSAHSFSNASKAVLPLHTLASATESHDIKRATRKSGGKLEEKAATPTSDPDFDIWTAAVIAGISADTNPNALNVSPGDVQGLSVHLIAPYEDGWTPEALSAALTAQDASTVRSVFGALRHRLTKELPTEVNGEVAPRLSTAGAREQAELDRLMAAGAASRTVEKYYWPGTTTVRVTM